MRECVARFLKTQRRPPRSACLWIGPEGDFSLVEIEQINRDTSAKPISLGPWVLRTDTATIARMDDMMFKYITDKPLAMAAFRSKER